MEPDAVVGDMDSIGFQPETAEILRFSPEKDLTDGMLALREAEKRGANEIILTCAVSRGIDHVMENIRMMLFSGAKTRIEEPDITVYALGLGREIEINGGRRVSVVPLGEAADLTLSGFKYDFEGTIGGDISGISNITKDMGKIRVRSGSAAVFVFH